MNRGRTKVFSSERRGETGPSVRSILNEGRRQREKEKETEMAVALAGHGGTRERRWQRILTAGSRHIDNGGCGG